MLISLNELKKLVDINISDNELFNLIGSRLVEIENVEDLAPKYKKIYAVKVLDCEDIPDTHLHLCIIDAGEKMNAEVDPEHTDFIQVVCGAPNVKKNMIAAWIAPGAIVPSTYGTQEPFEISARKLRGYASFGMLAAADELALGTDHEGIIELDPKTAKPGDPIAEVLDLNDKIIEVENKSLTHRPDCFGLIGFAREVAGILGQPFFNNYIEEADKIIEASNQRVNQAHEHKSEHNLPDSFTVSIKDYGICPRYWGMVFDFKSLPTREPYLNSDDIFLIKAGMKPISPIVDATNLIMLKTGQPLHAFDYDKFVTVGKTNSPSIGVRLARKDEKLLLLDGQEITLTENDIVITSSDTPVALAGAMGGDSTKIDEQTKRIVIEVASFSLYNLRKTQMAHGIFSEAITRFTKGRPALDLEPAVASAIDAFNKLGGTELMRVVDTDPSLFDNNNSGKTYVELSTDDINKLLGSSYSKELIIKTLENTNFKVEDLGDEQLKISVPNWRTDIHIKEDIIEEVGRLLGFDNLPTSFPLRPFVCPEIDPMLEFKTKLRTILSDRLGANELLTYSFVSKSLQEKVGEDPLDSYQIINSISPELECFRQSIIPSLLDKTRENEKAGYKDFTLYEINQVSKKSWGLNDENVPAMKTQLGLTTFGDFYHAKHILAELSRTLELDFELRPISNSAMFEPLHSAAIYLDQIQVGELGEIKPYVLKKFKLTPSISAISLTLDPCLSAEKQHKTSIKLSKFPFVSRDLTFSVKKDTEFISIETGIKTVLSQISDIIYILEPVSIFRKPNGDQKNLSFHLEIASKTKTLESKEISDIIETIISSLKTLGAEVV
ncbi:phenylalanine--tRNA ligase subunit beta [Candidatus Saccharibacteria bacterium]|nr:phenylalanine--tRNA ligase subunit beta [Candidatus Saccharibacteria bacterium]